MPNLRILKSELQKQDKVVKFGFSEIDNVISLLEKENKIIKLGYTCDRDGWASSIFYLPSQNVFISTGYRPIGIDGSRLKKALDLELQYKKDLSISDSDACEYILRDFEAHFMVQKQLNGGKHEF